MRHKSLDGWRGIGALFIAIFHLGAIQQPLFIHAYMFVDFFLVLSGYVIEGAYSQRLMDRQAGISFLGKRFIRIYPVHITVLAVLVAAQIVVNLGYPILNPAFVKTNTLYSLATNVLLLHGMGFHSALSWNWPSWTISSEFWVYVAYVMLKHGVPFRGQLIVAALVAAACWIFLIIQSDHGIDVSFDYGFLRCLMDFMLGLVIRRLLGFWTLPKGLATAAELAIIGVIGVLFWFGGWNRIDYAAPLVFAALVMIYSGDSGLIARLLCRPVFQWLGERSYAFYMVHLPVVLFWFTFSDWVVAEYDLGAVYTGWVKSAVSIAVVYPVVLVLADLLFRYVERPAAHGGQKPAK